MNDNRPKQGTSAHLRPMPLLMLLTWGGLVFGAMLCWYGVYRAVVWAITLPIIYESYTTSEYTRVDDTRHVYSCEDIPRKIHHQG